jgi:Transposase DDE domain
VAHGADRAERRALSPAAQHADRQEPSAALKTKTTRLKEKIAKLKEQMQRLRALKARMLATPDQQISLTDPDSRSMATSGRGSGVVGYNVQVAVDTEHHLIVTHEVTNVGTDRSQLAHMAEETKATLEVEKLDVVADRSYFSNEEILACENAGVTGKIVREVKVASEPEAPLTVLKNPGQAPADEESDRGAGFARSPREAIT